MALFDNAFPVGTGVAVGIGALLQARVLVPAQDGGAVEPRGSAGVQGDPDEKEIRSRKASKT